MSTPIFPSEALILGLAIGEWDSAGEPGFREFLTALRERLLPIVPSIISSQPNRAERAEYDLSRSLFDVIVADLRKSVAISGAEQKSGFGFELKLLEHQLSELDARWEWPGVKDETELAKYFELRELFRRDGSDDSKAIENYLRSLAAASGFEKTFEIGRTFGRVFPGFANALEWLVGLVTDNPPHPEVVETFRLGDFVGVPQIEKLEESLCDYPLAFDMISYLKRHLDLEFSLYLPSLKKACQTVQEMAGACWQAFGIVLGEVRERDQLARIEEPKRPLSRALQLGAQVSDDSIAEAIRNAQELVQAARGTPAVAVSQLAFAVETCIKRVCRKDLAIPNSTVRGAVDICMRSRDDRRKKFGHIALALREVYRHDATHESDELEVSWAEATFFVTGVQVLFELSRLLAKG